jgi:small subunit ribosomal protein S5e
MKGSNKHKKLLAIRIVAHVFEIIHLLAGQSPIQVCVYFILLIYATLKRVRKGSRRRHCQKWSLRGFDSYRFTGTVCRQGVDGLPLQHVDSSISPPTTGVRSSYSILFGSVFHTFF